MLRLRVVLVLLLAAGPAFAQHTGSPGGGGAGSSVTPNDCPAGQVAIGIADATGTLTCAVRGSTGSSLQVGDGSGGFSEYAGDSCTNQVVKSVTASGGLGCSTVTNAELAGSIAASKLVGTDIATVGTITSGVWSGTAIAASKGGTGQTAATEDGALVGNGTSFDVKVLPSCSDPSSAKLLYNSTTNAFSCGTDQDNAPAFSAVTAGSSTAALVIDTGGSLAVSGSGTIAATSVLGATTLSGNGTKLVTTTGTLTSGDCVEIDANGNFIASGDACGAGGAGTGTVTNVAVPTQWGSVADPTDDVVISLNTCFNAGATINTAITINWNNGLCQYGTMTGDTTFTFSNGLNGGRHVLILTQDGTGTRTPTWPGSVVSAPTVSETAGATTKVEFDYNGTTFYGNVPGGNAPSWTVLTAPTGNLTLDMSTYQNSFNFAVLAGTASRWAIADSTDNVGTGSLLSVNTTGSSSAHPFRACFGGTTNCVMANNSGHLMALAPGTSTTVRGGTSHIDATRASAEFALTGDISITVTADNTDNWAPSGWSSTAGTTIRLTTDAANTITGLTSGADGRIAIIHNVGSNDAILMNDVTSTAANRFLFGADVTLTANQSITLRYDSTSSRWRAIAGTGSGGSGAPTTSQYWTGASDGTLSAEKNLGALSTALVLNTAGVPSAYAGTSCTNQFPRSLSAVAAATCASVNLTSDITGALATGQTVTAGAGSGTHTLSGIICQKTATFQPSAIATEEVAFSCSIPANSLSADGKTIRVTAAFTTAANTNNKTIRVRWGGVSGTSCASKGLTSSSTVSVISCTLMRRGAASQVLSGTATDSINGNISTVVTTATRDETAANTIDVTISNTTATTDGTFQMGVVEFLN